MSLSRSDIRSQAAGLTVSQSAMNGQAGATMLREGNNMTALGGAVGTTGLAGVQNSGIAVGESEMDIEFGYLSEEESIFQSFS